MSATHFSALFFCAILCAFIPLGASAHQAVFVTPTQHDVIDIVDPTLSQGFYGELKDSPHLFRFTLTEPTTVFAEILVPDIDSATNDKSGLILESLPNDTGVREIKRLPAKSAQWESFYEFFSGDSYRRGSTYYDSLEAGSYLLEVSTPVNHGKYVLVVGKREEMKGYGATVKDIVRVKTFFGKSKIMLLQSPFVSIPLVLSILLLYFIFRFARRRMQYHRQ